MSSTAPVSVTAVGSTLVLRGSRGVCVHIDHLLAEMCECTGMELEEMLQLPLPRCFPMDGGLKVPVEEVVQCPPLTKVMNDFRSMAMQKLSSALERQNDTPGGVPACIALANEMCHSVDQRLVPLAGRCWIVVPSLNQEVSDRTGGCLSMGASGEFLYHTSGLFMTEYNVFQIQGASSQTAAVE